MKRKLEYKIPVEYDGKRLIAYLRGQLDFSSRLVTKLKKSYDGLLLNGVPVRTIDIVREGDTLTVNLPEEKSTAEPIEYPLDIVYEDSDILVINKPAGLAMHPTHNHQGDTLANAVSAYLLQNGRDAVFHAVGRLDKQTSGLVLIALNSHAAHILSGNVKKEYLAIAGGIFDKPGEIDSPIYRPDPMKTLRATGHGDPSLTRYTPLARDEERTLLLVTPQTGRTHQIRVHFASVGAPLAGDDMYGSTDKSIARSALHCSGLTFFHPVTKEPLTLSAPLPGDMAKIAEMMLPV